jgi:DNA-3-methyladenine glycosylase II
VTKLRPIEPATPRRLDHRSLALGARALAARDPDLAGLLRAHGTPPLWGRRPGFATLIQIILEQQVSLAAARTMYRRLVERLGGMEPDRVVAAGRDRLRSWGLTRQKAAYCHGLAERVLDGLDLGKVARAGDTEGRALLLAVPGLGPWSVDIYFLMALRRPDVWPTGDLALAQALFEVKGGRRLPSRERQATLARAWAPWRSVAARLLWCHYLATRNRA